MTAYRPRHLSVSAVQLYVRCPAQYEAQYVKKRVSPTNAPMQFGITFHRALEAEHRGENSERALIAAWNRSQAILDAGRLGKMPSKTHALALLDEYKARGFGGKIGIPEKKFVMPFPSPNVPVPLLGYVDLMLPDRRRFREFKSTSMNTWTPEKVQTQAQLHCYGRAYQALYNHRVECAEYVIFRTDTVRIDVIEAVPSADGFRAFVTEAEAVWAGIVKGEYPPCGACPEMCKPPVEKPPSGPAVTWEE